MLYKKACAALAGGTHVVWLRNKIQKMLDDLTSWGKGCGLRFNPTKSIAVHFSRRHKPHPNCLIIDGRPVDYSSSVKYLGVTLDRKLFWSEHINNKIKNAKRQLYALSNIISKTWGPKPKLLKWAYTGMVRPALTYAAVSWAHTVKSTGIRNKLLHLDRLAMLTMAPIQRSTPTRGLAVMYNLMPLTNYV